MCAGGLYNHLPGLCVQGQAGSGLGVGVPEPKVCLKGTSCGEMLDISLGGKDVNVHGLGI